MGTPIDMEGGGHYSQPHKGYAREVFDALTRIADVLPLHSDQQKDSLRASFARVTGMLERGAHQEHNDFPEVAKALIKVAVNQPVLRLAALTRVCTQ